MPPKKKGSSKKPAKARTPTLINGLTKEELSKEQLEEHILRLREELDREREERNYFQLERDKIHTLREVTERTLDETKAQLKMLDKEIEDNEIRHHENIKVYKQKMKHLLCEHQNTVCELKAAGLVSAEEVQKEQKQLEMKLHQDMRAIMVDMYELQIEIPVAELEKKHDEEMTATGSKWEKSLAELIAKNEEKMQTMQQELDNLRKSMVSEIEDSWSGLITTVKGDHSIVMANIKALQEKCEQELKIKEAMMNELEQLETMTLERSREHISLLTDNKRVMELIAKANEENAKLQQKVRHYSDKTDTMEKIKAKELNALKRDHERLEQRFSELQREKDQMCRTFAQRMATMQQEAEAKCMQQEKEVQALSRSLEETQAQLSLVLSAPDMDHTALKEITDKLMGNLDAVNTASRTA